VPGWGKLVAGAVLGAVGAVYATNEEFRKVLPERARDLPIAVQRRFEAARAAAREAYARRRAEIIRELEAPRAAAQGATSMNSQVAQERAEEVREPDGGGNRFGARQR
jgi:hypothetical protein